MTVIGLSLKMFHHIIVPVSVQYLFIKQLNELILNEILTKIYLIRLIDP